MGAYVDGGWWRMTSDATDAARTEVGSAPEDRRPEDRPEAALPSFPEQISMQLGGWRGMVEAAVPITTFILVNMAWALQPALIGSVALAVVIASVRLAQRRPVRYALNGLFGIGLGAVVAWRTGEARDFYLPGILVSYGYAAGMIFSVVVRHPLVGWLYSVLFMKGRSAWRSDRRLMRTFTWLTLLWAAVWIAKVSVQFWLWAVDAEHVLGAARLVLGTPPYLLLLVFTVWVVRRGDRREPAPELAS